MENRYKVTLDFKQRSIFNVNFVQNNIDTAVIEFTIVDGGQVVPITDQVISIAFLKQDKTLVIQDISSGVSILEGGTTGKLQVILKSNTLASAGIVKGEISFSLAGKKLSTATFIFTVSGSLDNGEGLLSTNEIPLLDAKIAEIEVIKAEYVASDLGSLNTRLDGVDAQLADNATSVTKYGASPQATWQVNRDAFQAANDEVFALGGGKVLIPHGKWTVKGVMQDSRVEFLGNGAELVHPDGLSVDIITARVYVTLGTTTATALTLTVDSNLHIEESSVIGIQGAGGMSPLQFSRITTAITDSQVADITLLDTVGFATSGYLVVDNEIIHYTGMSAGGLLSGVTRGELGTIPASHLINANIGTSMRLVAEVISVVGNTITLDRPAILSVSSAIVNIGILYPKINGISFDGQKVVGTNTTVNAVSWQMVRFGQFNYTARNTNAALFLGWGARDNSGTVYAKDCSSPELVMGSVVWVFQQCHRNRIYANITGSIWVGVYLDNRTSLATEWDGSCDDNSGEIIANADVYVPSVTSVALNIVGSNRNSFKVNSKRLRTGVAITLLDQAHTADGSMPTAKGNVIDVRITEGYNPWVCDATGNVLSGYYDTYSNGICAPDNLKLGYMSAADTAPTASLFGMGTQAKPSMSFANDTNTGFYNIAPGNMQFVSLGVLTARFRPEGLHFADGKGLIFGTVTGGKVGQGATEKVGFWGKTPVVRPSAIPDTASATLDALETEVNKLKALLRTVGLMA